MVEIKKLFLFIHFVLPADAASADRFHAKWRNIITTEGPNPTNALCMLSTASNKALSAIEKDLFLLAQDRFENRCILDPCDDSDPTKVMLAEDLLNMFRHRGRFTQWTLPEIWASTMARRWTEGLKRELTDRGLVYRPALLQVVSCGQQWAGCLTKYSMLIPKYLGVTQTPKVLVELSTGAGWPLVGARFVECIAMDHHVSLFLFETADGRPMGQFLDGLRGIWEPLHVAVVTIDPNEVEVYSSSPSGMMELQSIDASSSAVVAADVGDGCQPRLSVFVGRPGTAQSFRTTMASARIQIRKDEDVRR